jgi:hypothetical protein
MSSAGSAYRFIACLAEVLQMEKLGEILYMGKRRSRGIAARLLGSMLVLASTVVVASDWSDTYIGYRYGHDYREPFNPNDISKNIFSLTHASGYKYGSNFFNVDMLKSNNQDLASGGGGGAQEVYVVYRTTLSGSAVFGKPLKFAGIIRDIGLTGGFDYNAKDDQFSARVYKWALGPKVSFDVPGFFDVAIVWRTEHNHNWYATSPQFGGAGCVSSATNVCNPNIEFKDTAAMEAAWLIPFPIGTVPVKFQGFMNYIGAKGRDGQGAGTKPETLLELALMVDVGSFAAHKDTVFVGVGYQYWHNKFGSNSSADPTGGSTARVPQLELEWHF